MSQTKQTPAPPPGPWAVSLDDLSALSRRAATARLLELAHGADRPADRERYEDEIIRLNMTVAGDVARRYRGRGLPQEDLEQVAYLGLVKAVKRFDPIRATDFLSFAVPTVRGELRRFFRDSGWTVRPPRSVQEMQARITAAEADLFQRLGHAPKPSEIAEHLGVDIDLVVDSLAANGCFAPASLDTAYGEPGQGGLVDRLGGPDPGYASAEARVALKPLMCGLTDRERLILEMRFFQGRTQAEIGEVLGVTQMQVSRLLARLLQRLCQELGRQAADAA